jgi:hypothetical protein
MIRGFANGLRIEIAPGGGRTIFIGANNGSGMSVDDTGSFYATGELLSRSTSPGHGCLVLTYSSFGGFTVCPAGYTINPAITPAATANGGIFYCCR